MKLTIKTRMKHVLKRGQKL